MVRRSAIVAQVVSWGSIDLLHNLVRTLNILHREDGRFPVVQYRAKVKLHGTNCAVHVTDQGLVTQSRTEILSPEKDYKGFARWVQARGDYFAALPTGIVVFGEWCGPGVERGMAVSALPEKIFAVFAVQVGTSEGARLVVDPDEIAAQLGAVPEGMHILPWEAGSYVVDFSSRASLDSTAEILNAKVAEVEAADPWILSTFGVTGVGEGMVLYPINVVPGEVPADPVGFTSLMFKAKGEKHRTAGTKQAVQVDATVSASVDDFVRVMVGSARLEQGMAACGGRREPRETGRFVSWMAADVRKESVAELEASGLTWSQVERAVQARSREWWLKGV